MDFIMQTDLSLSLFVLRLGLGLIFFAHSTQKVFGWFGGHGPKETVNRWKQRYEIPIAWGAIGVFTEFSGCLGVFVGFLTRPAALGLAIFMLVAMYKAHWKNGFFLATEQRQGKGHGIEYCLSLFIMTIALLIGGGGTLSIDRLLTR